MRRRPQPNRRRGMLRAAGVVVVLIALLAAALIAVSSLTAPTVNAPAVVPTPSLPTPRGTNPTPTRSKGTTPGPATPKSTPKPKRDVAFGASSRLMLKARPDRARLAVTSQADSVTASADRISWFSGRGDAYSGKLLHIQGTPGSTPRVVGQADPFVQPVWSKDGRHVMFVRVQRSASYPGARWTLLQYDRTTGRIRALASANALNLTPLGWSHGVPIYLRASSTESSIYEVRGGQSHFVSILLPQPIASASVSPDSRYLAFAAPASCTYCTLDIFDLDSLTVWNGPSGMPGDHAIAWTTDNRAVVTQLGDMLAAVSAEDHFQTPYRMPVTVALDWSHPYQAQIRDHKLQLFDRLTGRIYMTLPTGD